MRVGVHYFNFSFPGWPAGIVERLTETAQVADQGGVSLFTVMDHYFQMEPVGGPPEPMLEGYTTLGYLAAVTRDVRLSMLVTGTTYRYPGLLAKIVATLDVLSGGRAMLGIGAAWYDREHAGLGVPFPSTKERFERLEETLQICRQMWSDDDGPYDGQHYHLAETWCVPQPVQHPIPVMIGGQGERKTLRIAAQYAQTVNLTTDDPGEVAHKLEVLRGHCEDVGTDYDAIEKTLITRTDTSDPDAFLARMTQYARLGVSLVAQPGPGDDPVAWTTALVEDLVPRMRDI